MGDLPHRMSIGQMATLYGVSRKTLHLYQEKGLLEPNYVGEQTGYRYYTSDQGVVLDAVSQLQTAGLTLDEIKACINAGTAPFLESMLLRAKESLEVQERELARTRVQGNRILRVCDMLINKPVCGEIMIERLPERKALVFDVPPVSPDDRNNRAWDNAIRSVRTQLVERYGSIDLFDSPSGIITREELKAGTLITRQACIFVDDDLAALLDDARTIPGGQHLTMYFDSTLLDDETSIEYPSIRRMLRYAEENGFVICGDYLGETIANTPVLSYENHDAFFKMCLPIAQGTPDPSRETMEELR